MSINLREFCGKRTSFFLNQEKLVILLSMGITAVGEKLRELRELMGYKQGVVAEAVGLNNTAISYFESGKRTPTAEELGKLARFLCVSVDEFFRQPKELTPLQKLAIRVFEYELGERERDLVAANIFEMRKIYRSSDLPFTEDPFIGAEPDEEPDPRVKRPLGKAVKI